MATHISIGSVLPGRRLIWAFFSVAMTVPLLLATAVSAEDSAADPGPGAQEKPAQRGERSERRAEMRKKMLQKFDADGDGKLSDSERAKLRETMRKRHGAGEKGHGHQGDSKKGSGRRGRFGKEARERGPEGHRHGLRGHGGPPDLDKLFEKFDKDGDDRLDREEFKAALHVMREMHERRMGRPGEGRQGDHDRKRGRDTFRRRPGPDHKGRPGPPPAGRGPRPDRDDQE